MTAVGLCARVLGMTIIDDFKPYLDGNGLMSNQPVSPGTVQGSDNGPMFTAEAALCLDADGYHAVLLMYNLDRCIDDKGLLHRVPFVGPKSSITQVDDYYAVLHACSALGMKSWPRMFLRAMCRYGGCLNNNAPGTWHKDAFLARQPQLICAMISAAYPTNALGHRALRLAALPLYVYTALVIAVSCIGTPRVDSNDRRLAWHLIGTVSPVSWLCRLAAGVWRRRLYKDYGDTGMRAVAAIYYLPQGPNASPYSKYWPLT